MERLAVVTASAFSLPLRTCGNAGGMFGNAIVICPEITAMTAAGEPLNGTWTILMPAIVMNISPDKCAVEPLPPEPNVSSPGLAFASAINSRAECIGSDGCTMSILGANATNVTGAKSLTGS